MDYQELKELYKQGFNAMVGIEMLPSDTRHAECQLLITEDHLQPHGYLHGGVTLTLLETAASAGSCLNTNHDKELVFGTAIEVRHKKAGSKGLIRAVADFDREQRSPYTGTLKQYWNVVAYNEAGDVLSEGIFECKIVSKKYYAQKTGEQ